MEFVILDLETSGLNPKEDAIIEIALLRVDLEGKVLESWSSLVNPGFVIQEEITLLTNITPEELEKAPYIQQVRLTVEEFIGSSPIIGHNVQFDLDFLAQNGLHPSNELIIDTFRVGEILYYDKKSLNLSILTEELGYIHLGAHRAGSDVLATNFLFQKECERIRNFSKKEQMVLDRVQAHCNSPFFTFFQTLLGKDPVRPTGDLKRSADIFQENGVFVPSLANPPQEKLPNWSELLSSSGLEERAEQSKMAAAITEVFTNTGHLCIEAPTGIGKTFAYLIPAVIAALKQKKQVFVSTNTKTLQDQIEKKDIPQVQALFAQHGITDITFQKLKGRQNYLSLLKFYEFFDQIGFTADEAIFAMKVGFWLLKTVSGELDEISLYGEEYLLIDEIHAGDMRVLGTDNPYRDQEFITRARSGAKSANVVILNHALLLSEYLEDTQNGILPKIEILVLDEVHNLESVATESLKMVCDFSFFEKTVHDIEKTIKKFNKARPLEAFVAPEITQISESILLGSTMVFETVENTLLTQTTQAGNAYGGGRAQEQLLDLAGLERQRESLLKLIDPVWSKIQELEKVLYGAPKLLAYELERYTDRLGEYESHIRSFIASKTNEQIRILSKRERNPLRIVTTPLAIGPILREKIWKTVPSVVITSATLTIDQSFDYINRILALESFEKVRLQTDFNYAKQALLYIPAELGDVRKYEEKRAIEQFLTKLLTIFGGRTLMLFTSFATIKELTLALAPGLKNLWINLLPQGMGGGKHKLAAQFIKHSDSSVLLGTDSFWEGVDFAGDLLELLVIYKLPFSVPTDPIYMARSQLFADAFREYAIPMMILKLRQGIGRLIRTKSDKGVIVLLDKRVTTDWGRDILTSLPEGMPVKMTSTDSFLTLLRESREQSRAKVASNSLSW